MDLLVRIFTIIGLERNDVMVKKDCYDEDTVNPSHHYIISSKMIDQKK